MKYTVINPDTDAVLATVDHGPGIGEHTSSWLITKNKREWNLEGTDVSIDSGKLEIVAADGRRSRYPVTWSNKDGSIIVATPLGSIRLLAKRGTTAIYGLAAAGRNIIKSSMPGKIIKILRKKGEPVQADEPLLIIEAMKMENEIRAPEAGVIEEIGVREGDKIETGALLVRLDFGNGKASP